MGVAALSGPVDPERLSAGLDALRDLGFEPVMAPNLHQRDEHGLFAGVARDRLEAFHQLAADPTLKAVFFARGGHGVLPLLPDLDWDLLARHPRAYIGYSDLTPFLLETTRRLGLVTFHGPMVAADFARGLEPEERRSLLSALAGEYPQTLALAGGAGETVEGRLLGGCLSMMVATLGTEWAPRLEDALWLWEDVQEPLYRLDRMLTQCVLSNSLTGIRAMVVGHVVGEAGPEGGEPKTLEPKTLEPRSVEHKTLETWLRRGPAGDLGCPVAWGLASGHRAPNHTLPLGGWARLEPERLRLILLPSST